MAWKSHKFLHDMAEARGVYKNKIWVLTEV